MTDKTGHPMFMDVISDDSSDMFDRYGLVYAVEVELGACCYNCCIFF